MDPEPYDVLAVELSSFQLHYTDSMSAESAAVLNVAEDHLDWYAGLAGWPTTPPTRAGSTSGCSAPASTTSPTPRPSGWSARPTSIEGARAIGFTLGMPGVGMVGAGRGHPRRPGVHRASATAAPPSCARSPTWPRPAPHIVANALAAAALARAHGVSQAAVRDGLRAFRPDGHRIAVVAERDGVTWVDDSKATNPHAAQSSLQAYDPVVWVAGGLAKGARFDDLVPRRPRPAARRRAARPRPRRSSPTRFRDTRPMCPSSSSATTRLVPKRWACHGARRGAPQPSWPDPATRSCWLPDAPPWTCSPTTPSAATRSPRPYDAGRWADRAEPRGEPR